METGKSKLLPRLIRLIDYLKIKPFFALLALLCFEPQMASADDYSSMWDLLLGCPKHYDTISSGPLSLSTTGFSVDPGSACLRVGNGFATWSLTGATGGTLTSSTLYTLQMGKLSMVPPVRTIDSTPLFFVEAQCPTATKEVNWIFIQSPASRTAQYFWGRSTMTPTSTTMTKFYNIDGVLGFSGSYSLPVGSCLSGVFDVSGSGDMQAKIYSADAWSGFYKTGPGNASFFVPVWNVDQTLLANKTYVGLYFTAQDPLSSKNVQVISNALGTVFTVKPFSNPHTNALDSSYTETITITDFNSPLAGMMRGTISQANSLGDPQGTIEKVGCVAYDLGGGGYVVSCAGKNPQDNTKNYSLTFNYKEPPGTLDATFGAGTGYVIIDIPGTDDKARAMAIQSDGKIIGAGDSFDIVRFHPNGSLDTSFGSGGHIEINVPGSSRANAVAIQLDGKILVAGNGESSPGGTLNFFVVRLNSNGTLDPYFDSDPTKAANGTGSGMVNKDSGRNIDDQAYALALQPDGKIILAGYNGDAIADTGDEIVVMRFNPNGTTDTQFDSDPTKAANGTGSGVVRAKPGSAASRAYASVVQSDGKILVGGNAGSSTVLLRYQSGGSLDPDFDGDSGTGNGIVSMNLSGSRQNIKAIAIQADGKILAAGRSKNAASNYDLTIIRYLATGRLDTSFDGDSGSGNGVVRIDVASGKDDSANSLAVQPDGSIVLTGDANKGSSTENIDFCVVQIKSNGTKDTSFNGNGILTRDFGGGEDEARQVVLQADGKIVVFGEAKTGLPLTYKYTAMRLWP